MVNNYKKNNNELLKEQCFEYLGGKICINCGTRSLPAVCYDFHHKNGNKEENISQMIQRKIRLDDELKKELNKCVVTCANCHRMITAHIMRINQFKSDSSQLKICPVRSCPVE